MSNTVFIVDGLPNSGKNSFVTMIREKVLHVVSISYHDALQTVAKKMGWKNIPNDKKNYAFLGDLHALWTGFNDNLINQILERASKYSKHTIIIILPKTKSDMEELVKRLKDDHEVMTVLVYNKRANTNISLADRLSDYDYDIVVNNNKGLSDLKKEANMFIARYIKSFMRLDKSPIQRSVKSKRVTKKNKEK